MATLTVSALHICSTHLPVLHTCHLSKAAGSVRAERVHPSRAGSRRLRTQTHLPSTAGPQRQLPVQPPRANRSAFTVHNVNDPTAPLETSVCIRAS